MQKNISKQEVYTGTEKICTIEGLHFNSIYRARVRAYNLYGLSQSSKEIHLQTAEGIYLMKTYL